MKKFLSFILVFTLLFSFAVPVFAEGDVINNYTNETDLSPVTNWFQKLWDKITEGFTNIIQKISDSVNSLSSKLDEFKTSVFNSVNNFYNQFLHFWDDFKGRFITLNNKLSDFNNSIITWFNDKLTYLFVPTFSLSDKVNSWKSSLELKISSLSQIKDLFNNLFSFSSTAEAPKFEFTYHGTTVGLIDFSAYAKYRVFVQSLISFFMWFVYLRKLYRSLPGFLLTAAGTEQQAARLDERYGGGNSQ